MFAVRVFSTASFLVAIAAAGHASATAAPSPEHRRAHTTAPLRLHLPGNSSAAYRILDVGSPNTFVDGSAPEAFNNTGQIVGYAEVATGATSTKSDCVVWTGTRFVDMSPGGAYLGCGVVGLRDASATSKAYVITGTVAVPLKDTAIGFITSGTPASTTLALTTFQGNSIARLASSTSSGTRRASTISRKRFQRTITSASPYWASTTTARS